MCPGVEGQERTRKEVYVLAEGSFYVTLSGSLRQEDTHDYEYTHTHTHTDTDTRRGRSKSRPDTHKHKYHSDQKPVRADRGPARARLGTVPSTPQLPGSPQTWWPGRPGLGALSRPEGFPGWRAPQEAGS